MLFPFRLKDAGITCKSSIGSTPSCSQPVKDMAQLSEVHPGNYVFYGGCTEAFIYLTGSHYFEVRLETMGFVAVF